ncbi:MAG TPA: hypothetical protein PKZ32_12530, partial [Candidatus Melainabacteria bacterium]|nr:hypothetical protein [Candidatus Melainabacteria bacterium]
KTVDPTNALPSVTLRGVNVGLEGGLPKLSGEIWNPGDEPVNSLNVKVELVDTVSKRVLWTRDQKVVDEFVQPLQGHDSKSIDFVAGTSVRMNGTNEFKVYLDGKLYKSYRLGEKSKPDPLASDDSSSASGTLSRVRPKPEPAPAPSPAPTPGTSLPQVSPEPVETTRPKESAEDKTMKDLE